MKINLIAPINDLGYGYTGLHILDELIKLGHKVALFPIGQPSCHPRHEASVREGLLNADEFDINAPCIRLWHQHDMSMFVGRNLHIGFPIFELDTFTAKEKHHLQSCDELFVCSKWAAKICYDNFDTPNPPVAVIPLGVDTEVFQPVVSRRKPTIFLNVGKWETRKGHAELIRCFNLAFNDNDNVELWMMCDNPFLNTEQTKFWHVTCKTSKLGGKIRIIPRVDTDEQVAEIMQQADCGVFPSKAEGWNLEALEMLSCGKNVIITNYSAHTEFLTQENALLIPINEIEPAYDGIWFHEQGNWAKLGIEQQTKLIEHLQRIHEAKQTGVLDINDEGIETANKYTWKNTAKTILRQL